MTREDLRDLAPPEQALVLAEAASRRVWELLACVFMARQAQAEATEESNEPAVRISFRERERLWFERAFARLEAMEQEAPVILARLDQLGFDIDNADRDPNQPPEPGGPSGQAPGKDTAA